MKAAGWCLPGGRQASSESHSVSSSRRLWSPPAGNGGESWARIQQNSGPQSGLQSSPWYRHIHVTPREWGLRRPEPLRTTSHYFHITTARLLFVHTKIHFQDFAWKGVPGNAVWTLASRKANRCPKVTASDSERTCAQFSTCPPWVHASSQTSQAAACPTQTQDGQERQGNGKAGPPPGSPKQKSQCAGCPCRSSHVSYAAFTQPALPRGRSCRQEHRGAVRPHSTAASRSHVWPSRASSTTRLCGVSAGEGTMARWLV